VSQPGENEAAHRDMESIAFAPRSRALAATGIAGLDEVLGGGLTRERLYLIEGPPGAGETTTALQFLLEGKKHG
jgi:circadian clock protein KaiC